MTGGQQGRRGDLDPDVMKDMFESIGEDIDVEQKKKMIEDWLRDHGYSEDEIRRVVNSSQIDI